MRHILPAILSIAALTAADPALAVPGDAIVEIRVPDAAATLKRWEASPYAQLAATAWGKRIAEGWTKLDEKAVKDGKPSPLALAQQIRALAAGVGVGADGKPAWTVAAEPKDQALFAGILAGDKTAAWMTEVNYRIDGGLAVAGPAKPAAPSSWKAPAGDVVARMDSARAHQLYQAFGMPVPAPPAAAPKPVIEAALTLDPIGLRERVAMPVTPELAPLCAAWAPVDRRLLASLPPTTLGAIAMHFDSALMGKALAQMGYAEGNPAFAQMDGMLHMVGLPPYLELIQGLDGDSVVYIEEGVPFPSVTMALGMKPAVATQVQDALKVQAGFAALADGTLQRLVGIAMVQVAWIAGADGNGTLVATSSPFGINSWKQRKPGFADLPEVAEALKQVHPKAVVAGASRSGAAWSAVGGLAMMALAREPSFATLSTDLRKAGRYGFISYTVDGGQAVYEAGGLFGGPLGMAAMIGGNMGALQEMDRAGRRERRGGAPRPAQPQQPAGESF